MSEAPPPSAEMRCHLCRKDKPYDEFNIVKSERYKKSLVCFKCWESYQYGKGVEDPEADWQAYRKAHPGEFAWETASE